MQRLRAALDAAGVTTWFDMDRLESGDDYDRKIQKNIARCSYFIPIVSATTERRLEAYFRREWSHALDRTRNMADDAIFILPVCIDQTEPRGAHPAAPAETQPAVDPQHPWLGLASFTEETRGYFHGREEEVAELGRRVQRKLLTILFGQSGLGKTSILRAGIVPRLRHKGYCPVYVRIDHSPESPTPTEQIKQAIHRATQSSGQWTQAGTAVEGESLWEFLHHRDDILRDAAGKTVIPLLIFDQFEEIFTLAQADDAITGRFDFGRVDYRILIALREDYLAHLSLICRELNNARIAQGRAEISADLLAGSNGTILAEFHERALADQPAAVRKVIEDQPLTESGYRESLAEERLRKAFAAAGAAPDALATLVNRRLLRIEERLDVRRVELTHDVLCGVVKASRELRLEREAKEEAERLLATQRARGEAEKLVVYLRRTSTSSSSPSGASTSSRSPWRPGRLSPPAWPSARSRCPTASSSCATARWRTPRRSSKGRAPRCAASMASSSRISPLPRCSWRPRRGRWMRSFPWAASTRPGATARRRGPWRTASSRSSRGTCWRCGRGPSCCPTSGTSPPGQIRFKSALPFYDAAAKDYRSLLNVDAGNTIAWNNLAVNLMSLGLFSEGAGQARDGLKYLRAAARTGREGAMTTARANGMTFLWWHVARMEVEQGNAEASQAAMGEVTRYAGLAVRDMEPSAPSRKIREAWPVKYEARLAEAAALIDGLSAEYRRMATVIQSRNEIALEQARRR